MEKKVKSNFREITIRVSHKEFDVVKQKSSQNGLIPSAYAKQSLIWRINKVKD